MCGDLGERDDAQDCGGGDFQHDRRYPLMVALSRRLWSALAGWLHDALLEGR